MKKNLLALFIFVATFTFAQPTASIKFLNQSHSFGSISENDGIVSCEFSFQNTGDAPLVISQVTASCGCTTPNWTKEPVAPGKTGVIKASYNTVGRPGPFTKTITVMSNAKEGNVLLTINGNVSPKQMSMEDIYPFSIGELRLKSAMLSFYDVSNKGQKTDKMEMYNSSKQPLTINFDRVSSHLSVVANPTVLAPGAKGEIVVTYKGTVIKDWGPRRDDVYILLNNEKRIASDRKFIVSANLVEDFSFLTSEQKNNAPKIDVSSGTIDFSYVKSGEKKTQEITLTNTGKSVLHIRKVRTEALFLEAKVDRMSIPVGKSATLKVTILPTKIKNGINERISVISNDPLKPVLVLRVLASN